LRYANRFLEFLVATDGAKMMEMTWHDGGFHGDSWNMINRVFKTLVSFCSVWSWCLFLTWLLEGSFLQTWETTDWIVDFRYSPSNSLLGYPIFDPSVRFILSALHSKHPVNTPIVSSQFFIYSILLNHQFWDVSNVQVEGLRCHWVIQPTIVGNSVKYNIWLGNLQIQFDGNHGDTYCFNFDTVIMCN
jgi:hypothetical protein